VNVQEAHGYMRAIQQCSTDLYRTAVTSSYCVSYCRLAINTLTYLLTYLLKGLKKKHQSCKITMFDSVKLKFVNASKKS